VIRLERLDQYKALVLSARQAAQTAYAPYSNVAQGAALLSADGKIYKGSKMECAAYGGSIGAETSALTAAITDSVRKFDAIALYPSEFPCGTTRQMLIEFGSNLDVVLENDKGELSVVSLKDLLPCHFGPDNLS